MFRRPGDIHVHVFGTATISFSDGIKLEDEDIVEINCPTFGRPLVNRLRRFQIDPPLVKSL